MKFIAALLVLLGGATVVSAQGHDHVEDPKFQEMNYLMTKEGSPCVGVNYNDMAQDEAWQACKAYVAENLSGERRLQSGGPPNNDILLPPGETYTEGSAADFVTPCYPLPADPGAEGWTLAGGTTGFADDGEEPVTLDFDFNLYGTTYEDALVAANGGIAFRASFVPFITGNFPTSFPFVAPFWSDVDVRPNTPPRGEIWYKKFEDVEGSGDFTHLAVIWNEVGYANGSNDQWKTNTFQAVISDGGPSLGPNNICFCYVDMDWWVGGFARNAAPADAAATVGVNAGDMVRFSQIGRFFGEGDAYDGPGGDLDGIDWLDYQGSNTTRVGVNQTDPIEGICFNTAIVDNIPPVVTGFPIGGTYNIPCRGMLDLSLNFATPEMNQIITVDAPTATDAGILLSDLGITLTRTTSDESITIDVNWSPDFAIHASQTYVLTFSASDREGSITGDVLSTVTRTLTIVVAQCGDTDDLPENCTPIIGNTCPTTPQPYCTPHRSPEHCPMDESFPTYIHTRNQIVQNNPASIAGLGYWYHYLLDKAAAYAFTASSGYNAPQLLCCASPATWMDDCFPSGGANPSSFVVRAVGDQHSNAAVYVLPSGFGGPELTRPLASMSMAQVDANIQGLTMPATKIIVEEYIAGSTTGPSALPNEYKIHAFNGNVGAINMILNRGSECACYAEVDQDYNRLDLNGCFVPNMPFGQEFDGVCYGIDFEDGATRPYPMKGHDLCGTLDLISPSCLLGELVRIAEEISLLIGVYVRIDFFVGGDNKIYIQEYTFNHNNGLRHCSSKVNDDTDCIDSCFLGRMWKNSGSTPDEIVMGGPVTALPGVFAGWTDANQSDQCATAMSQTLTPSTACA